MRGETGCNSASGKRAKWSLFIGVQALDVAHEGKLLSSLQTGAGVDNIDYFPVTLRDQKNGELDTEYLLANVLGLVDCVDMQKSKVEHWESGMGFDFLSMAIDPAKARGFKLFRLKDDPTKVIIDEELKQHFEATDMLVGVTLIQTEDYRDR